MSYNIIIKPIVSEKMTTQSEELNRYAFVVDKRANKLEIKSAVEQLYGVSAKNVNTMNYDGRNKSRYTKSGFIKGKTNAFKKAIVTLEEGEAIDFYSNL